MSLEVMVFSFVDVYDMLSFVEGYYPPNHHIVTGTDGMDSYEALWYVGVQLALSFTHSVTGNSLLCWVK